MKNSELSDINQALVLMKGALSGFVIREGHEMSDLTATSLFVQLVKLQIIKSCIETGGGTWERCSQCLSKGGPTMDCPAFRLDKL